MAPLAKRKAKSPTQAEEPTPSSTTNHEVPPDAVGHSASASKRKAWVDDEDAAEERSLPAFYKKQNVKPTWAMSDKEAAKTPRRPEEPDEHSDSLRPNVSRKRFRHEDLDRLLSQTAPLLASSSANDRHVPQILSTVALPRDTARTVQWHPGGQLLLVGGNRHVYLFHCAGKFVEQLSKVDLQGATLKDTALTSSGEDVLLTGKDAYAPVRLNLSTGQLTPLRFLDTRDGAVYRHSRDETPKAKRYITKVIAQPAGVSTSSQQVAVASGNIVRLGSLSSGCVTATVVADAPVSDLQFLGDRHLYVASGNRLLLYDVRMSSRFVQEQVDEGALQISCFSVNSKFIGIGSTTGVVSLYSRQGAAGSSSSVLRSPPSLKTFSQLTTSIKGVYFGVGHQQQPVISFFTHAQKSGFRLARGLPEAQVVPSFPAVSTRHEFIHCVAFGHGLPVLSVGEKQRVVNYAI